MSTCIAQPIDVFRQLKLIPSVVFVAIAKPSSLDTLLNMNSFDTIIFFLIICFDYELIAKFRNEHSLF